MRRRLLPAVVAVVFVLALVVAPSASATAVEISSRSVPAAEPLPYIPSPTKWRQWMVNVVSSVLGKATPNKWKAEQIANAYKYDGGFETLNRKFGIDGIRYNDAGQIVGVKYSNIGTGTYTDVVIAGLEQSYAQKAASGKGPVRAPATPIKSLFKFVGGAATVAFAYELGSTLGAAGINAASSPFLGFDANGVVCGAQGYDNDFQKWVFRTMSGQNCDAWDLAEAYDPNSDLQPGAPVLSFAGSTWTYWGTAYAGGYDKSAHCWIGPASPPSGYQFLLKRANGTTEGTYNPLAQCFQGQTAFTPPIVGARGAPNSAFNGATSTLYLATNANVIVAQSEAPPAGDPDRQQKCTVTYTDATTASLLSPLYNELDGAAAGAECPNTPAGKTPDNVRVEEIAPGQSPIETYDEDVTPEYQDWWEDYPECRTGACKLDLIRKTPTPAISCFDLEEGCVGWAEDPAKTDKYLCRYGVHDVALEECNVYSGIFQPGRITTGSPYSDPTTGEWSGGQNAPREADNAMTRTIQDPELVRSCNFPNAFLDPVGAAIAGGQCLIEWATIPRPVVAEVAFVGVQDVWAGKPPAVIASVVQNVALTGPGAGCSIMTTYKGTTAPLLDACGGQMAIFATFSRIATTALMAVLVFNQVRRQIAAMVNYNVGQG